MINLIIFSKDRAFQLEALLRSIRLNCDIFHYFTILIKASNDEYKKGYEKFLKTDSALGCNILWEDDKETFGSQLKFIVDRLNESPNEHCKYTCFMVDDIICFKKFDDLKGVEYAVELGCQYSLRLGMNIEGYDRNGMQWNERKDYQETKSDFDYPYSTDGHIYKTELMKEILSKGNPINPNKFEVLCYGNRELMPKIMTYPKESVLVSIPVNRVSDTATASFGKKYGYTEKELNDRFLNGEILDFENMDFTNIIKCHKEIEFKFTNQNK